MLTCDTTSSIKPRPEVRGFMLEVVVPAGTTTDNNHTKGILISALT